MRPSLALVGVAALLALAPGAQAATSVTVEKGCYAEGDNLDIHAAGYSPDGSLDMTLERDGRALLSPTDPKRADAAGRFDQEVGPIANETGLFGATETRFTMTLRVVDEARRASGQPADSPEVAATTAFIFSRWNVAVEAVKATLHPRRSARIRAVGYTNAVGKPLYAHWLRNDRRVHTRRLGTLRGPCGDTRMRLAHGFPFRPVAPGSYRVTFNTSRKDARAQDSIVHAASRVARRISR